MPGHEPTRCPRCDGEFECCVGSISRCPCTDVVLGGEDRARIAEHYESCLCVPCLGAIAAGAPIGRLPPLAARVPAGAPPLALRCVALGTHP